jgi:hypothetical protein
MWEKVRDEATVSSLNDGLLVIHYVQIWEGGVDRIGNFVCEASAARWLADRIDAASEDEGAPEVSAPMPPDHFTIFVRGDRLMNAHVHNERDPNAPRGGLYVLSGIEIQTAKKFVADLRALKI